MQAFSSIHGFVNDRLIKSFSPPRGNRLIYAASRFAQGLSQNLFWLPRCAVPPKKFRVSLPCCAAVCLSVRHGAFPPGGGQLSAIMNNKTTAGKAMKRSNQLRLKQRHFFEVFFKRIAHDHNFCFSVIFKNKKPVFHHIHYFMVNSRVRIS
jgi:hypothetical protein